MGVMSTIVSIKRNRSSRTSPLLAGRNRLLEMVASGAPLQDILNSLALLIESQIGGTLCSVLLLDQEGRLHTSAAPSLPEEYTKAIEGISVGPAVGSCGTAVYRNETVVVADTLKDPLWKNYRGLAIPYGLRACWSAPFFSRHGHVLGTFAMYYRTPRRPVAREIELLAVASRIASIAVDRSQSDAELRRAAETYRSLVENLNDVVFSIDLHGNFSYISPTIERHSGYSPDEIIGRPFHRFVHPDDLEILQKSFADTLAGRLRPHDFRVIAKDGVVRWCRTSSRPQVMGNQVVGITGVMVDITDEKHTHEALKVAEEKYRTIFEEAVVGIFQSEPSGRYVTVNPALARMYGYDSPAAFTASITDVSRDLYVDPQRRNEFLCLMEREGRVRDFEVQVYRKDRSTMWLSTNARAIRGNGRIVGFEGTIEEITQRKLIESQLLRAQKMEALGQLAGGIAHDFNNLLGVILGHGELLLNELPATDPSRRRVEQIWHAGKRSVSLAGQLLTFSRQQASRAQVLDLNVVVQGVRDLINQIIGENIELIMNLNPLPNWVKADAGQIEQILLNLAVN